MDVPNGDYVTLSKTRLAISFMGGGGAMIGTMKNHEDSFVAGLRRGNDFLEAGQE